MSWGWVAAIVAVLVIIGNWMWLAPTPRERRLARMREKAFALGLRVQRVDSAHLPSAADAGEWISYYLPGNRKGAAQRYGANELAAQHVPLAVMPPHIDIAYAWLDTGAGLCWKESGNLDDVAAIAQYLSAWLSAANSKA